VSLTLFIQFEFPHNRRVVRGIPLRRIGTRLEVFVLVVFFLLLPSSSSLGSRGGIDTPDRLVEMLLEAA
jgi:hypothetical protein